MKKVISILMVAFAMTAMVACGDEKDNGGNNNGGNNNGGGQVVEPQNKSLEGTTWQERDDFDNEDGYMITTVSFQAGSQCKYDFVGYHSDGSEDNSTTDRFVGTYTYDGYRGTFKMKKASSSSAVYNYDGTFYVDEGVMHTDFRYERNELTQVK